MHYQPELEGWRPDAEGRLPVSEIFYSVQGEGRFAGTPAVFIRMAFCNLGCIWCDTRFTWDRRKFESASWLTAGEIAARAEELVASAVRSHVHVVLTGGEPMLHQEQLPSLIDDLRRGGFSFIEIETNGMYIPSEAMTRGIDWWNCSPKLTNNGLTKEINIVPAAIQAILATGKVDFKFVVQAESDIVEVIRDYLPLIPQERVILMPEGITRDRQLGLIPWLMDTCQEHGFRFSPRLHILAYGNERGK